MKGVIDYYNKTAAQWAETWYNNNSVLPYLKELMALLPPNPLVIDLCCGAGYESMRLQHLGARVIGLDLSKESIKIAAEKNPSLEFYVQDMLQDYAHIAKADGLICVAGLIHLSNSDMTTAFQHMHNALHKRAPILIVVREGVGRLESSSLFTIENEQYDRNFICHTKQELVDASKGLFEFLKEMPNTAGTDWRYYLFQKVQ